MLIVLDDELEVLRDMRALDRDVFNYLAARVDFDSGMIGQASAVSYGGIALDLTERPGQGRASGSVRVVDRNDVRHAVDRLIDAGLLRSFSEQGKKQNLILLRIFWGRLLDRDKSVQKEVAQKLRRSCASVLRKLSFIVKDIDENKEDDSRGSCAEVGITSLIQQQQGGDHFVMFSAWQPTMDELEMSLYRAGGYKLDQVPGFWIAEFIDHWRSEGKRRMSQAEWTKKLAWEMVADLRDPGRFDRLHGVNQPGKAAGKAKASGLPEWASPPRDNTALGRWMRQHDYGDGPPGLTLEQTRNWLTPRIEARLKQWRQLQ
jgi:hypothetical protein